MIQLQMSRINLDCGSESEFTFSLVTDRSRKDRWWLFRMLLRHLGFLGLWHRLLVRKSKCSLSS